MRGSYAIVVVALGLVAAGCTTTSGGGPISQSDPNDPWESTNRQVFAMNQGFDQSVLLPAAQAYVDVVPDFARDGVHNFLDNFNAPVVFANDVLQGEVSLAGDTIGRFGLNSTIGLGGLIDVATPAGIPDHSSDFGQTLGVWGVGGSPYLVLPLLGPDDPRDAVGQLADIFMDPFAYVGIRNYVYWGIGEYGLDIVDTRARNIDLLKSLEQGSVDLYASERSLYMQYRKNKIQHGKSDVKDLPEYVTSYPSPRTCHRPG